MALTLHVFSIFLLQISATTVVSMTSVTINGVTDTLTPEHEKYANALETAAAAFHEAEDLFADDGFQNRRGWKQEEENDDGDIVYGKATPKGKMVTVSTILAGSVDEVINETWTAVDGLPVWNPNINYASTIVNLTDHADIVTYGNNDILVVSGRDFVSARIYRPIPDGGYMVVSRSVEVPEAPAKKGKVRAHLYLAAARFRPDPSNPSKQTLCDVVMLVDLKGMLPRFLVNQVTPKIMMMDIIENKKHFKDIAEKKTVPADK